MSEEQEPQQLIVEEIVGPGRSTDGTKFTLRLRNPHGYVVDLFVPYQLADDFITLSIDAANAAYEKRRELNLADEPTQLIGGGPRIISFQFPYAASGEYMTLVARTNKGPIEIRIPRDQAVAFAEGATRSAQMLEGRDQGSAH